MKKLLLTTAALLAFPAQAANLLPGSTANFDPTSVNSGTLIASNQVSGSALTFSAQFRSAVYRRANGMLDFVYQVAHTGPGTLGSNHEITGFTVAEFGGFTVDALRDGSDHDGAGVFTAPFNPVPGGFTSLAKRNASGLVLTADFHATGLNGLLQGETSTSYIFRTNARAFKTGTFGVIDGSTLQGFTFAPTVPEPATWAMMIGGFGLLGAAARRSRRANTVLA